MQIPQPGTKSGSFGIPQHVREAGEKFKQAREEAQAKANDPEMEPEYDTGFSAGNDLAEPVSEQSAETTPLNPDIADSGANPIEVLEKLGVTLDDEDYHKIVFRGFLEKDIVIMPAIKKARQLEATMKTLSGQEYDLVDELIAEDLRDLRMTQQGYDTRRSMWILAFGITKMGGKPICPVATVGSGETKRVDQKATARKKREILGLLHPAILSKMIKFHGALTLAINEIVTTPEADYLKKS